MTERLSDEDLSEIMNYELEPSPEDVSYMAARLIDLRDHLSSGPVMPEVPSRAVVRALVREGWDTECIQQNWTDIRNALRKHQP